MASTTLPMRKRGVVWARVYRRVEMMLEGAFIRRESLDHPFRSARAAMAILTPRKIRGRIDKMIPISTRSMFLCSRRRGMMRVKPPEIKKFRKVIERIRFKFCTIGYGIDIVARTIQRIKNTFRLKFLLF